ncbi:probable ATP-dependent RNA helicase DDX10 [Chelonus insularis]|uniref:probable ATP-dependent RNA helicase DDX10 n=1 Tax=Chelonus insularis TaxID=460826 RepID=UPI00158B22B7|nr:probable ATP-dependent RNA helicase DDX10 [Chelonus insularis]
MSIDNKKMAKPQGKKKKVNVYQKKKSIPESKIIEELQAKYKSIDETKIKKFSDFPLSSKTLDGLSKHKYIAPTDIQKQSIGLALAGNDILGAAKTGSGKTLAFLIPILEKLYCMQWSRLDGIGALVITPTRELAYQIYETLRKVGIHHDFSAGLIIGGMDLNFEKNRLDKCNIIIGTPGRILQHMDNNPLFNCTSMKILVLDEADRCLDMGFQASMNAIIENLPPERQTLLFSATQTKSVKDLARLSLKDPMYVSVHEHAKHVTPEGLQQSYVICNLEDKMAMLWSFIKYHPKQKIIVFFATCKQAKYVYEVFCKLYPNASRLMALYGTIPQWRRVKIYEKFHHKQIAVLFATDIASRGLDFPAVHWVVQMDCPEDTNAYIHRAGRTARFQENGESLLVLLPSEEKMVDKLIERKIPINKISINPNKLHSPHHKLEAFLVRDVSLKESAQRAFVAYVKSVFLMKDKEIFNVHALDTASYARSLGLAVPPRLRFIQRRQKEAKQEDDQAKDNKSTEEDNLSEKMLKNQTLSDHENSDNDSNEKENNQEESSDDEKEIPMSQNIRKPLSGGLTFFDDNDSSDDEDILTVKRKNIQIEDYPEESVNNDGEGIESTIKNKKIVTKAAVAKKILRKKILPNKKTTFDDEGNEVIDSMKSKLSDLGRQYENAASSGINIEEAKKILREEDKFDKQRFREKIKQKHKEEKRKLKEQRRKLEGDDRQEHDEYEEYQVRLGRNSDSESDSESQAGDSDPDQIHGPKNQSSDNESDDDNNDDPNNEEESEIDEEIHRPPKRKLLTQDNYKKKKQRIKILENTDLTMAEELALQLLKK